MPPKKGQKPRPGAQTKASTAPVPSLSETDWPPLSVKHGLESRVVEQDQIIIIDDLLTDDECKQFIKFIDNLPLSVTPPAKRGEADRVNDRISIPSASFANSMYTAIHPHLPVLPSFNKQIPSAKPSSCNSNIRLYRYAPGQYFGPHYDDSVRDAKAGTWSEWTILVYLSGAEDGVVGGETVFYKETGKGKKPIEIVAPLKRGSALLHRHGMECMLHEGREVTKGTKYVLRSDLMFSR